MPRNVLNALLQIFICEALPALCAIITLTESVTLECKPHEHRYSVFTSHFLSLEGHRNVASTEHSWKEWINDTESGERKGGRGRTRLKSHGYWVTKTLFLIAFYRELTSFLCEESESTKFRLWKPPVVSVARPSAVLGTIKERRWLCLNKTLFTWQGHWAIVLQPLYELFTIKEPRRWMGTRDSAMKGLCQRSHHGSEGSYPFH